MKRREPAFMVMRAPIASRDEAKEAGEVEEVKETKEKRSASPPDEPLRPPDEKPRRAKIVA